jgi:hypothetical protein
MQNIDKLILGGVYNVTTQFSSYKAKVLAFDDIEVLYDEWHTVANKWLFDKFKGKGYFSRMPSDFFINSSSLIEVEQFSKTHIQKYRPDLPLRFGRIADLSWESQFFENMEDYQEYLKTKVDTSLTELLPDTPEMVLYPYGSKGALRKGQAIKASNGKAFTTLEALWQANNLQSEYVKSKSNGIGLYRLGIEKGLQSYYIGEFHDRAGISLAGTK